jgi:hypothetical protein
MTSNANRSLGFIKRNVITKNKKVKEVTYKSLVRPQVEYASTIWSPNTKTNFDKIEMVQSRAIRWVKRDYSPPSSVTAMRSH